MLLDLLCEEGMTWEKLEARLKEHYGEDEIRDFNVSFGDTNIKQTENEEDKIAQRCAI